MFLFGFLENIKAVSYPLIKAEFGVSYETQGRMVSLLSFSYTFFCVAAGFILSRFGLKKVYLLGFIFALAGLGTIYFMPGFWTVALSLFLVFSCFGLFEIGINGLASVLFTKKAALLLNVLHALYGVGAIAAPFIAGKICNAEGFTWRNAYVFALPLMALFFVITMIVTFPDAKNQIEKIEKNKIDENQIDKNAQIEIDEKNDEASTQPVTFLGALKVPLVWLFGITLGTMMATEMATSNWGSLYFQDVYGIDPTTLGAAFVSSFFLLFTLSRLISGFAIEKLGYMKSLIGAVAIIMLIVAAGFALGRSGIYVIPAIGFFIAILWPTVMAVAIGTFGKNAPVMSSAVIAIGGLLNATMQLLTGLVNNIIGAAWGYRLCIVLTAALLVLLLALRKGVAQRRKGHKGIGD
jgi:fucose permease